MHTYKQLFGIFAGLILSGCQQPANEQSTTASNEGSLNELGAPYIVSDSYDVMSSENYVEGGYFLAPLIKYSTIGLMKASEDSGITDDGGNYIAFTNIFESGLKTMSLDLYYNSEDSRDKYNNIFGLWRPSFTSFIDFKVDYDNANIKSKSYDSAKNACELGFNDIKLSLYRGLLFDATTFFDSTQNLCVIRKNQTEVGTFNVWNKSTGIVGDFHYLTKPNGETLVFSNAGDEYSADDRGVKVSMHLLDDGTYEYIDANSYVNTYSSTGKLTKIMYEGQETNISYDDKYKITKVDGPLESLLLFNYSEDESLESIVFGGKEARFSYNTKNQLSGINILTDESTLSEEIESPICEEECSSEEEAADLADDDVVTDETVGEQGVADEELSVIFNLASFTYNQNSLLESIIRDAIENEDEGDDGISAGKTTYVYDDLNRVVTTNDETDDGLIIDYKPTVVKRDFTNGKMVTHQISYKGSRQQVENVEDEKSELDNEFNNEGQLTEISLIEEPDVDDNGNIIAQGLEDGKKRMTMNFAYNTRGLVNKIQYASVSTGKKFVQLDYKSRYPKPTKVLTNDAVTFFDINQKGQLIRKTSIKFTKEMRLRAASITEDEVLSSGDRYEKSYIYDDEGFLSEATNEVDGSSTVYEVNDTGKVSKKLRIKEQFFWGGWLAKYFTWYSTRSNSGWTASTGSIKAGDADVQTVFVGGMADKRVDPYAENSRNHSDYENFYEWHELDTFLGVTYNGNKGNPFNKSRNKLVVVGHSYGGDSAVEASKTTDSAYDVDLLITVDPVGVFDYNDGAKHWIQLYAQSGRPTGGYMSWKKGHKTITWQYYRCHRHRWHFHCRWVKRYKTITYRYPGWTSTMKWNGGDWVAFAGGKGWYSSYDPGDGNPDQFIKIPAHHGDFKYMLWKMEHGTGHITNNEFGITNNAGVFAPYTSYFATEKNRARKPADYGFVFWKW